MGVCLFFYSSRTLLFAVFFLAILTIGGPAADYQVFFGVFPVVKLVWVGCYSIPTVNQTGRVGRYSIPTPTSASSSEQTPSLTTGKRKKAPTIAGL